MTENWVLTLYNTPLHTLIILSIRLWTMLRQEVQTQDAFLYVLHVPYSKLMYLFSIQRIGESDISCTPRSERGHDLYHPLPHGISLLVYL